MAFSFPSPAVRIPCLVAQKLNLLRRLELHLVDEGGVAATVGVETFERDGMEAHRQIEGVGGVKQIATVAGCEGADHGAIDQHLERLRGVITWALGSVE